MIHYKEGLLDDNFHETCVPVASAAGCPGKRAPVDVPARWRTERGVGPHVVRELRVHRQIPRQHLPC